MWSEFAFSWVLLGLVDIICNHSELVIEVISVGGAHVRHDLIANN